MESVKKFIKNHKTLLIVLGVILVFLIASIILVYKMFFDYGNDKYGNRLNPIEGLEISKHTQNKLKEELTELENVDEVKYSLSGRLINVIFKVNKDLDKDTAKEYGNKVLEYFSDEEKDAYDIQVFVLASEDEGEEKKYPIIGYRKASLGNEEAKSRGITWSNN